MSECTRCKSTRLFQFEVNRDVRSKPTSLPVVCRDCGQLMLDGAPLALPADLEATAKNLAQAATEAGARAAVEVMQQPETPIAAYFARHYRDAYLDGFFRALVYSRHHAKEGRLHRMRELWTHINVLAIPLYSDDIECHLPPAVYDEFRRLLFMGMPGDPDAKSSSDQHPSVSGSDARMP